LGIRINHSINATTFCGRRRNSTQPDPLRDCYCNTARFVLMDAPCCDLGAQSLPQAVPLPLGKLWLVPILGTRARYPEHPGRMAGG
jgi:hypothetical protein